jgi:DNA-directed RNA polymerase specialized sigma24 family protein
MRKWNKIEKTLTRYATSADFCRIFYEEMNSLYLLSFLLTADCARAEKCFLQSLENAARGRSVFREWARSWARRMIIHNAIRLIEPRAADGNSSLDPASRISVTRVQAEIAGVIELPGFERFVFVLSVFEGFSDQECSLLVNCTRREVVTGRNCALRRIAHLPRTDRAEMRVVKPSEAGLLESESFAPSKPA